MFKVSALRANTSMQTVSPFIDSSVINVLIHTNPNFNQMLFEFINILDPPELVIDRIEVRAVGGPQIRRDKVWGFALQQFDRLRADALVHCPAETRTCHQ